MKHVLVTGGAGYIGSHACKALKQAGYVPVTFDNLVTGWRDAVKFGPFEQGDLLDRAAERGVHRMVTICTSLAKEPHVRALAESYAPIFYAAGTHPMSVADDPMASVEDLVALARHPKFVGIGETGLDFNRNFSPPDVQLAVFRAQIALAVELGKPLFVHDRDSDGAVFETLAAWDNLPPTVVHCFTGSAADLAAYLDAGFYIGITGWVADVRRGAQLRELVARIPLSRLLLETDAPFLRPHNTPADFLTRHGLSSRMKRRNEPALLPYVCAAVAECYGIDAQTVAAASVENAQRLFFF